MKQALLLFFLGVFASHINAQNSGDSLYLKGEYDAALKIYQHDQKKNKPAPQRLYRMGICFLMKKNYPKAIEYMQASRLSGAIPQYNLACAYAESGNNDSALACLSRSVRGGFLNWQQAEKDSSFAGLKNEPRFSSIILDMKKTASPCEYDPKYREFDFWIGEWNVVSSANGAEAGNSSIQRILGSCVIFENWTGTSGNAGKSFNTYTSSDDQWRQTWVDNQGSFIEFTGGKFYDNAMHFTGSRPQKQNNGPDIIHRLTFFKIDENTVRQFGEQSTDDGKNWQTEYDLTYKRKQ